MHPLLPAPLAAFHVPHTRLSALFTSLTIPLLRLLFLRYCVRWHQMRRVLFIFRALADMAADNKPIDVVTVSEWMKGRVMDEGYNPCSFLEVIGGLAYLGDLAKDTPSSANIVSYAHIVRHYSLKRQVIHLTTALQDQAFQQGS